MKELYWDQHYVTKENGKFPVIGTPLTSILSGSTQPFIQRELSVTIQRNRPFLIYGSADKKRHKFGFDSILDDCHCMGDYPLTDNEKKELKKFFPNFTFNSLGEYVSISDKTNKTQWKEFYDVKDKRLKFAKIYSPFSHLKNGLVFKGEKDPNKDNKVLIQLINNSKIRCSFSQ